MGRHKGGKNNFWTKEQKYNFIIPVIEGICSSRERASEVGVCDSLVRKWVIQYNQGGIEALENKRKPGNPMVKYFRRKELTYTEQLEYENMKLRIENERLKKGYTSKEADLAKQKK